MLWSFRYERKSNVKSEILLYIRCDCGTNLYLTSIKKFTSFSCFILANFEKYFLNIKVRSFWNMIKIFLSYVVYRRRKILLLCEIWNYKEKFYRSIHNTIEEENEDEFWLRERHGHYVERTFKLDSNTTYKRWRKYALPLRKVSKDKDQN